ncbi:MAG: DUF2269 family protein [Gaiellales bacterium]
MHLRETLLFLHIGSVMVLAAAVGVSVYCKAIAIRTASATAARALLVAAGGAIRLLGLPASLVMILTGALLVQHANGAWRYDEPWIVGAMVLWLASAVVGARMHAPRSRAARAHLDKLETADEPVDDTLRQIVRSGRLASVLDTAFLAGMVAFMVFKPTFGM